jgi:hypothetical protein
VRGAPPFCGPRESEKGHGCEMISALLLVATVLVSAIVVRIGAIAFEMTGLDREKASFQALSCFSGTGFTTREAELVTSHHYRRRIATVLMIFGNAGLATVITTLVVTAKGGVVPSLRNVGLIFLGVGVIVLVLKQRWIMGRVRKAAEDWLRTRTNLEVVDVVEILHQPEGYGIASLRVDPESTLAHKGIAASGLRIRDILVLSIERSGVVIPLPTADRTILPGDSLICYGQIRTIHQLSRSKASPGQTGSGGGGHGESTPEERTGDLARRSEAKRKGADADSPGAGEKGVE